MNLESVVPGDQVIDYLIRQGATSTDAHPSFPGGRHFDNIARYVELIEAGDWWESTRPVYLDAKTGQVWQGTDRTAALAQVDWTKAPTVPNFTVIVEHPRG